MLADRVPAAYLLIAPMILILGVTSLYPLVYGVLISLFDWDWGQEMAFVGLENSALPSKRT